MKSLNVPLFEGKLERRRSKMAALLFQHATVGSGPSTASAAAAGVPPQLDVPPLPPSGSLPRNISEGQLMNFVGQVGPLEMLRTTNYFVSMAFPAFVSPSILTEGALHGPFKWYSHAFHKHRRLWAS